MLASIDTHWGEVALREIPFAFAPFPLTPSFSLQPVLSPLRARGDADFLEERDYKDFK